MKVYIVTEGSYSERYIVAVFSTVELAENYVALSDKTGSDCDIEPYEVDEITESYITTCVGMHKNGKVFSSYRNINGKVGLLEFDYDDTFWWSVKTEDKERAIKVTNEKRVQILAMNLWGQAKLVEGMGL